MYVIYGHKSSVIRTAIVITIAVIGITFLSPMVYGHDDLPTKIGEISRQIQKDPQDVELYVARGYFYLLDGNWEVSLIDFDTVERLSSEKVPAVPLLRAKAWFIGSGLARNHKQKEDRLANSLFNVDSFMLDHPEHPDAFKLKADTLAELGRYSEAISIHRELIGELKQNPGPEYYTKHADWLIADKRPSEAVKFLDTGINHLGVVEILQDKAIGIDISQQNFQSALKRTDTLLSGHSRKDKYLVQKADILRLDDQEEEAVILYNMALDEIEKLSSIIKRKKHTSELKEYIIGQKEDIEIRNR